DGARAELARDLGQILRLDPALGADAERIQVAAADVAEDQVLQHLLEELAARVEQEMPLRAERAGALAERGGRGRVEAAGVDRDGHDRPLVGLREPRDAERRVEPAREGEHDRPFGLRHDVTFLKAWRSRARSRRCCAEPAVATKIVSSPDTVPTTSGHAIRSSVTATRCAAPTSVAITSRFGPAVRMSRTNSATTRSACSLPISFGFGKL